MTDFSFSPEGISLRTLHDSQDSLRQIQEMLKEILTSQSLLQCNAAWDSPADLQKVDTFSISKRYDLIDRGLHPRALRLGNRTKVWNRFEHRKWMGLVEDGMRRGLDHDTAMSEAMEQLGNQKVA